MEFEGKPEVWRPMHESFGTIIGDPRFLGLGIAPHRYEALKHVLRELGVEKVLRWGVPASRLAVRLLDPNRRLGFLDKVETWTIEHSRPPSSESSRRLFAVYDPVGRKRGWVIGGGSREERLREELAEARRLIATLRTENSALVAVADRVREENRGLRAGLLTLARGGKSARGVGASAG